MSRLPLGQAGAGDAPCSVVRWGDAAQPNEQMECRRRATIQISGILWPRKISWKTPRKATCQGWYFRNCYIINFSWVAPSGPRYEHHPLGPTFGLSDLLITPRANLRAMHEPVPSTDSLLLRNVICCGRVSWKLSSALLFFYPAQHYLCDSSN